MLKNIYKKIITFIFNKVAKNKLFSKKEKSSFRYWLSHNLAYQITALELNAWKVKHIFHDFEKPWLKLLWKDYSKVKKWHRNHNAHHLEWLKTHDNCDWDGMVIDWECSKLTKRDSPLTAREYYNLYLNKKDELIQKYGKTKFLTFKNNFEKSLDKLGL